MLHRLDWVSLGGGISFTSPGYALDAFCARLRRFAQTYAVTVYLEPGAAVVRQAATLEVKAVDVGCNGKNLAVVDSSTEAHMLDLLIYREAATIGAFLSRGEHRYQICGKTCLAGDIFGEANFNAPLQIGDRLSIADAGAYTMVKKNWFNGVNMPSIVVKELDGSVRRVREVHLRRLPRQPVLSRKTSR